MKLLRTLVLALYLALLFTNCSTSNAQQVDVTGNLVNFGASHNGVTSAWQNVGQYGGSLNCWSPWDAMWGAYCGPLPYVNANGYGMINFSYGYTDLNQTVNVANAVPNTSGLQINGFIFSYRAKNGNGWDGGQTDYLNSYVNFYSPTGGNLASYNYNLNYRFDWTNFTHNETFTKPYSLAAIGTVRYGFVGGDSNYWAGPYGPEVTNVNFQLKYSVDPCASNPLYSPTCAGYGAAYLASVKPATTTSTVIVNTNSTSILPDPTKTDPTVTNVGGVEMSTTGKISTPDNIPQVVKDSQTTANTASTPKKDNSAAVAIGLNAIKKNAEREQNIVNQTLSAVEANNANVQASVIQNVLSMSREQSTKSAEPPQQAQQKNTLGVFNGLNIAVATPTPVQVIPKLNTTNDVGTTSNPTSLFGPINNLLQGQTFQIDQNSIEQRGPTVNKNTPNNSLAGGVTLESISKTPQGFELYMTGLVDRPFYAPREIYRGQKNVDNANATRFLNGKNDVLHQMMVEQQYNIGN